MKNSFLSVLALLLALVAAASAVRPCLEQPEGGPMRSGGFSARQHDDPTIAEVTKFAYEELAAKNANIVKFHDFGCPKTQVVAGIIYNVLIDVCTAEGDLATYEASVYEGFDRTKSLRSSKLHTTAKAAEVCQ